MESAVSLKLSDTTNWRITVKYFVLSNLNKKYLIFSSKPKAWVNYLKTLFNNIYFF